MNRYIPRVIYRNGPTKIDSYSRTDQIILNYIDRYHTTFDEAETVIFKSWLNRILCKTHFRRNRLPHYIEEAIDYLEVVLDSEAINPVLPEHIRNSFWRFHQVDWNKYNRSIIARAFYRVERMKVTRIETTTVKMFTEGGVKYLYSGALDMPLRLKLKALEDNPTALLLWIDTHYQPSIDWIADHVKSSYSLPLDKSQMEYYGRFDKINYGASDYTIEL